MANTKTMYKGINKLVQYVALCDMCNSVEVSNTHNTSRGFVTYIRAIGWNVSNKNVVTCPKCSGTTTKNDKNT